MTAPPSPWQVPTGPRRLLALVGCLLALALPSACAKNLSGLSVGDLRTIAKRVDGGGAECPLSIPVADLRPSTVAAGSPVRPDIANPSHAASGTIGSDLPGSELDKADGVSLTCRYLSGRVRITLRVVGVGKGHAVTRLFPTIRAVAKMSNAEGVAFVDTVVDLPAGRSEPLPDRAHAAYAAVAGHHSSIAILLSVSVANTAGKVPTQLPTSTELAGPAARIAVMLGS